MFLFFDVALEAFKDSSAGRSRAGLSGETEYCEASSKDRTRFKFTKFAPGKLHIF
jgi:hypothetical protein